MNIQELATEYQKKQEEVRARYGHLILTAIQHEMIMKGIERAIIEADGYPSQVIPDDNYNDLSALLNVIGYHIIAEVLLGCSAIITQESIRRKAGVGYES